MRAVVGIIVGLIAALIAAVIAGIVALGTTFSPPPGTDATDLAQVARVFMALSPTTLLALAAAWLVGGFGGALVAKAIARRSWAAWAVALVVAIYFGLNAFLLMMPLSMQAAWFIAPLLGGLLGNLLVRDRATPEAAATTDEVPADQ